MGQVSLFRMGHVGHRSVYSTFIRDPCWYSPLTDVSIKIVGKQEHVE